MLQESNDKIFNVPLGEIFSDDEFNCRGKISPIDVVDLAKDIQKNGLQQPIILQPYKHTEYKYKIICGHRRHMACIISKLETIPAIIRANLSDLEARKLNLSENLKRKDLNILQEAKAIEKLKFAGLTQHQIAEEIGMSRGWVQVRVNLLELPLEIQEAAAAGFLTHEHIRDIYSLPTKDAKFEAVRNIKDAKLRGDRSRIFVKKKPENIYLKRERNRAEIFKMMDYIQEVVGNNFGTRCLAWAAGEVSELELYSDLKRLADEKGIDYIVPETTVMQKPDVFAES